MTVHRPLIVTALVLVCVSAVVLAQQAVKPLTNEGVVSMVSGGLDESLVIGAIEANTENFDVSPHALLSLKKNGVGDKIIQAMLASTAKKQNASVSPPISQNTSQSPAISMSAGMPLTPAAMNPMLGQAAAAQALAMQMMASQGMSPQMLAQMAAAQRGRGMGMFPGVAMSSSAPAPGMSLDSSQLPKVAVIGADRTEPLNASITQIAKSEIKGGKGGLGMPSMGGMAALGMRGGMGGMGGLSGLSTLGGLGGTALRFAPLAAGPGMMFAGPAMSFATGLLGGGLAHHSSTPKATYVWALPGAHSSYVMSSAKPRFEIEFGDIVGLDPDGYEPALVKLTQTKDNWRLVGATKDTIDKRGNEKRSAITEDRVEIKTTAASRGHVIIESAAPLAPGEYGVVLHPIKTQKSSASTSSGLSAEQTIYYSIWDFSIPAGESFANSLSSTR